MTKVSLDNDVLRTVFASNYRNKVLSLFTNVCIITASRVVSHHSLRLFYLHYPVPVVFSNGQGKKSLKGTLE